MGRTWPMMPVRMGPLVLATAVLVANERWPEADTECAMRQLAFSFGASLLREAGTGAGINPSPEMRLERSLGLGDKGSGTCATPPSAPWGGGSRRHDQPAPAGKQWFVDSRNGSDANSGSALGLPFQSLERARAAVRSAGSGGGGGHTVWIRGGTHWQAEPFLLSSDDSGASETTDWCHLRAGSLATWQSQGLDRGSTISGSITTAEILAIARRLLGPAACSRRLLGPAGPARAGRAATTTMLKTDDCRYISRLENEADLAEPLAKAPAKLRDTLKTDDLHEPPKMHIELGRAAAKVGRDYVGHAWDCTPEGNQSVLKANLSDPRLIALVKNLGSNGGSVLRIGGGASDCTVYAVGPQPYPTVECGVNRWAAGGVQYNAPCTSSCPGSNISGVSWCLTMQRWDELNAFAGETGLKIIYGLSGFHGQGGKHAVGGWKQSRPWDPTNVKALLKYSADKKFVERGTLMGFEMGNEITENEVRNGTYWGQRFVELAALITEQWPDQSTRPGLYGPDQTRSGNYGCKSCFPNWTASFLHEAAPSLLE